MKKDPRIFLEHVLDSIKDIEDYTKKISLEKFMRDKKTQDAVVRRLEIIGEAVKNLPETLKKQHPEIIWKEITGMRDILIHEYFGIHLKIVWATIKKDLPVLKKSVLKLLQHLDAKGPQLRIQ